MKRSIVALIAIHTLVAALPAGSVKSNAADQAQPPNTLTVAEKQAGFEVQINNTYKEPRKTGSLYAVADVAEPAAKDDEWFSVWIGVEGKHVQIKINDKLVVDWTEPEDFVSRNPPWWSERRLSHGTFALQAHDEKSVVYLRNLKVKPLNAPPGEAWVNPPKEAILGVEQRTFRSTFRPGAAAKNASGPLRVHPTNPRYFTDGSMNSDGTLKAVYLTGSHTWNNQQEIEGFRPGRSPVPLTGKFDFDRYLDFLDSYHHNFYRHWIFEFAKDGSITVEPHPWPRTGPGLARDGKPKFDLSKFDPRYFERLHSRVTAAHDRGIYVAIVLFESSFGESAWAGHPFNKDNNVNGVDGGSMVRFHALESPAVVRLQEAYLRQVVDTVNHLDNVLYEICNEPGEEAEDWCVHFCKYIKDYQTAKPKQHPVGLTALFDKSQWNKFQSWIARNDLLFNGPYDWIAPGGWTKDPQASVWGVDPPANDGRKVVFLDPDHIWPVAPQRGWIWKCFARGHQPILMDWYDSQPVWISKAEEEAMRQAMGHTRRYADRMNLAAMTPRTDLASTQYCLANPGKEYLVYLPEGGAVTVDLSQGKGIFGVEWFNPRTGTFANGGPVEGGAKATLKAPFEGDAVVYLLTKEGEKR